MKKNKETVAANVVTYNRKKLLVECLDALLKQTYPLDAIYIIDNASTNGTPKLLKEKGYIKDLPPINLDKPVEKIYSINMSSKGNENKVLEIHYVRMNENTGSSGGQYEGVKRGYEKGYDWLWLMDDDTIPHDDSLEKLYNKSNIYKDIGFLCSKVLWTNGSLHLRSSPSINNLYLFKNNTVLFNLFEDDDVYITNCCTFVSVLINRKVIQKIGYPIKEFFIWLDDIEFTSRIFKSGFLGLYVKDSKVIHKTKDNITHTCIDYSKADNYYFFARNQLYLVKKEGFLYFLKQFARNFFYVFDKLKKHEVSLKNRYNFSKKYLGGTIASIIFWPRSEKDIKGKK